MQVFYVTRALNSTLWLNEQVNKKKLQRKDVRGQEEKERNKYQYWESKELPEAIKHFVEKKQLKKKLGR